MRLHAITIDQVLPIDGALGFSGTRQGMTPAQRATLATLLDHVRATEFHHGSCTGADVQAHVLALERGIQIILHPSTSLTHHAQCHGAAVEYRPQRPLDRNRVIASSSHLLIATPKDAREVLRSGTWATVRYMLQLQRPAVVIDLDGRIVRAL